MADSKEKDPQETQLGKLFQEIFRRYDVEELMEWGDKTWGLRDAFHAAHGTAPAEQFSGQMEEAEKDMAETNVEVGVDLASEKDHTAYILRYSDGQCKPLTREEARRLSEKWNDANFHLQVYREEDMDRAEKAQTVTDLEEQLAKAEELAACRLQWLAEAEMEAEEWAETADSLDREVTELQDRIDTLEEVHGKAEHTATLETNTREHYQARCREQEKVIRKQQEVIESLHHRLEKIEMPSIQITRGEDEEPVLQVNGARVAYGEEQGLARLAGALGDALVGEDITERIDDDKPVEPEEEPEILDEPLDVLNIPTRAYFRLKSLCGTVGDLTQMTEAELRRVKGIGKVTFNAIRKELDEHNLSLKEGEV